MQRATWGGVKAGSSAACHRVQPWPPLGSCHPTGPPGGLCVYSGALGRGRRTPQGGRVFNQWVHLNLIYFLGHLQLYSVTYKL